MRQNNLDGGKINNATGTKTNATGPKIIAISDLEGFDINTSIPNKCTCNSTCPSCANTNIYICGDIIDSTFFNSNDEAMIKAKSFNLRNIQKVISSNNIKLFLGNRDINKVKLIRLGKLSGDSDNITAFNNGTLAFDQYTNLEKTSLEWNEKMENWPLFWVGKPSDNTSRNSQPSKNFINRFNDIFVQSMGAGNLLNTIPIELKLEPTLTDDNKAFIVLLVFNSMLQKVATTRNTTFSDQQIKAQFCQGWLYDLFAKSSLCSAEVYKTKTYVFSHGGITGTLYNNIGNLQTLVKQSTQKTLFQTGGATNNVAEINVIGNLANINSIFETQISSVFNNNGDNQLNSIHFLLGMSADFNFGITELKSTTMSPILPGFPQLVINKDHFYEKGKTIVQVFGHKPLGFAASVFKFELNSNTNTILINLDSSVSFKNTNLSKIDLESKIDSESKPQSRSYLEIDASTGKGIINSQINFSAQISSHTYQPSVFKKIISENLEGPGVSSPTIKKINISTGLNTTDIITIQQDIDEVNPTDYDRIKCFGKPTDCPTLSSDFDLIRAFHGNAQINNIDVKLFTVVLGWNAWFFILNKNDYETFTGQKIVTEQKIVTGPQKGDFKQKYLKYKAKYLNLKNNMIL